jgi:hypothetical protein
VAALTPHSNINGHGNHLFQLQSILIGRRSIVGAAGNILTLANHARTFAAAGDPIRPVQPFADILNDNDCGAIYEP